MNLMYLAVADRNALALETAIELTQVRMDAERESALRARESAARLADADWGRRAQR